MDTKHKSRSKILPIIITVCTALVLVAGIGGWVYVQRQKLTTQEEESRQEQEDSIKRLKFQECEATKRARIANGDGWSPPSQNCEHEL